MSETEAQLRQRIADLTAEMDRRHHWEQRQAAELQAIWDAWRATPNEVRHALPVPLYNLLEMCSGRIRVVYDNGDAA